MMILTLINEKLDSKIYQQFVDITIFIIENSRRDINHIKGYTDFEIKEGGL